MYTTTNDASQGLKHAPRRGRFFDHFIGVFDQIARTDLSTPQDDAGIPQDRRRRFSAQTAPGRARWGRRCRRRGDITPRPVILSTRRGPRSTSASCLHRGRRARERQNGRAGGGGARARRAKRGDSRTGTSRKARGTTAATANDEMGGEGQGEETGNEAFGDAANNARGHPRAPRPGSNLDARSRDGANSSAVLCQQRVHGAALREREREHPASNAIARSLHVHPRSTRLRNNVLPDGTTRNVDLHSVSGSRAFRLR